jgi:zinc and cadmium transporter
MHAGFSRARAFAWNLGASLTSVLGGLIGWLALREAMALLPYALAVAAASLIYVAVADLIPGLHRRTDLRASLAQIAWIAVGVGVVMVAESQLH